MWVWVGVGGWVGGWCVCGGWGGWGGWGWGGGGGAAGAQWRGAQRHWQQQVRCPAAACAAPTRGCRRALRRLRCSHLCRKILELASHGHRLGVGLEGDALASRRGQRGVAATGDQHQRGAVLQAGHIGIALEPLEGVGDDVRLHVGKGFRGGQCLDTVDCRHLPASAACRCCCCAATIRGAPLLTLPASLNCCSHAARSSARPDRGRGTSASPAPGSTTRREGPPRCMASTKRAAQASTAGLAPSAIMFRVRLNAAPCLACCLSLIDRGRGSGSTGRAKRAARRSLAPAGISPLFWRREASDHLSGAIATPPSDPQPFTRGSCSRGAPSAGKLSPACLSWRSLGVRGTSQAS